jgi:hypothetical protein
MITAVAAIVLGVWDSTQNRRHNRLSVAPYLDCSYTMSANRDATAFVITVSNEGIGPAIVRSVEITMPVDLGGGSFDEWGSPVAALRERGIEVLSYWNFEPGEALGVQNTQELLRARVAQADGSAELLRQLADIRVTVTYASIYGDEQQAQLN